MNKSGKIPLTSPLQRKYLSATSDDPLAVMKVTWPGSMYLSVSRDRIILCWESIREIHKPGQFYCGERENDILTVSARHSYDIVEQGRGGECCIIDAPTANHGACDHDLDWPKYVSCLVNRAHHTAVQPVAARGRLPP
jgi:hypothetical protein